MIKANLFLHLISFDAPNLTQEALTSFCQLSHCANEDIIYANDLYSNSAFLSEFISNPYEFDKVKGDYGIDYDTQQQLIAFFLYRQIIDEVSTSFSDFDDKYGNGNNGLVGLDYMGMPTIKYVYNEDSWQKLHCTYLKNNNQHINWDNCNEYFPNLEYSNKILLFEVESFYNNSPGKRKVDEKEKLLDFQEEIVKKKPRGGELEGYAEQIGHQIAERNYYTHDAELSSREQRTVNSKRKIYSLQKGNSKQYLSIDFEKGVFEVHNSRGEHLGEYRFYGIENGQNTQRDDHYLRLLRRRSS